MTEDKIIANWDRGINNMAPDDRLPEGYVRDLLNFDPVAGKLRLRPRASLLAAGSGCKNLTEYRGKLLYTDGSALVEYSPATNSTRTVVTFSSSIVAAGVRMGEHNGLLYIANTDALLTYNGYNTEYWAKDGSNALTRPADRPEFTESVANKGYSALVSHNGVLLLAAGEFVYMTDPLMPDRIDPLAGFFHFPGDVGMLLSGLRGVYISADKCYSLVNPETDSPEQSTVLDYPAIPGSGIHLRDGRAAWITEYGMAVESTDPRAGIEEPNKGAFAPPPMDRASAGVVEVGGVTRVVASSTPNDNRTGLAASDYFEAEVIRP